MARYRVAPNFGKSVWHGRSCRHVGLGRVAVRKTRPTSRAVRVNGAAIRRRDLSGAGRGLLAAWLGRLLRRDRGGHVARVGTPGAEGQKTTEDQGH